MSYVREGLGGTSNGADQGRVRLGQLGDGSPDGLVRLRLQRESDPALWLVGLPALVVEGFVRVTKMKFVRDSAEGLRVSQKKKAPGCQGPSDAGNDGSRDVNREVHRYVAAENCVETIALPKQRVVLDKVSFLKSDRRPHGLVQLKVAAVAAKILRLQIIGV